MFQTGQSTSWSGTWQGPSPLWVTDLVPPVRTDPVAAVRRADAALAKVHASSGAEANMLHSSKTLADELGSPTRNTVVLAGGACITKLAVPTELGHRAFEPIGVPLLLELKST